MIYLNLVGGLGNQMFEYACAKHYQSITNDNILISTFEITCHDKKRVPSLSKLILNTKIKFTKDKLPWCVHRRNYVSKVLRKLSPNLYYKLFSKLGYYVWYEENAVVLPAHPRGNIYLGGYWQSENYFKEVLPVLKNELVPKKIPDSVNGILFDISSTESICLHVRRGDYINSAYQVCTVQYYNRAIKEIRKYSDGKIFVFSDDITWAMNNLEIIGEFFFVPRKSPDYIDLYMMAKCHSFIISNSTFSWWAQELGDREGKVVIAPYKWRNEIDCKDIYKKEWVLITV